MKAEQISDLTAIIFEEPHKYFACSSGGEFLFSADGTDWIKETISDKHFTSIAKEGNTIILTGKNGVIYFSKDIGKNFEKAVSNTTDDFLKISYIKDRFVAVTETGLYTSKEGDEWFQDSAKFDEQKIQGLYVGYPSWGQPVLYIMTDEGIRDFSKFNNIEDGAISTARLGGVNFQFEKSKIKFKNGGVESFDIAPNDTMHIFDYENKIAKIVFNGIPDFKLYTDSTTISEDIFNKKQECIVISGDNSTLYFQLKDEQYTPISKGDFWLKDGKVFERPASEYSPEEFEEALNELLDTYVKNNYESIIYNNAPETLKNYLPTPLMVKEILINFLTYLKALRFNTSITYNQLLCDSNKAFSPLYMTCPFFRQLYLDTQDSKIYLKDAYLLGPTFISDLFKKKDKPILASKFEYVIDKQFLTGKIQDFQMNVGPFQVASKKATVKSDLSIPEANDELMIDEATFAIEKMLRNFRKINKNKSFTYGSKVAKMKLTYNPKEGFKLKGGEIGAEIKIPELNLTKHLAIEEVTGYFGFVYRETDENGNYLPDDIYPDELGEEIVIIDLNGYFHKRSPKNKNFSDFFQPSSNDDLRIRVEGKLAFDNLEDLEWYNLQKLHINAKNAFHFPRTGPFSLNGIGGGYTYGKKGSYWHLNASYNLFRFDIGTAGKYLNNELKKITKSLYLFEGDATIFGSLNWDSFGIGLLTFTSPILRKKQLSMMVHIKLAPKKPESLFLQNAQKKLVLRQ